MPPPKEVAQKAGASRRNVKEVEDSHWKQRGKGSRAQGNAAATHHHDVLGELLSEQERLIQARYDHVESHRKEHFSDRFSCSSRASAVPPAVPSAVPTSFSPSQDTHGGIGQGEDGDATKNRVPFERTADLTVTLLGDFVDELAEGYAQPWFQELLLEQPEARELSCHEPGSESARECARAFLRRLQELAFQVQRPILQSWGFEGEQGLFDMTSILLEHSKTGPSWLQEKIDACLFLLYGGPSGLVGKQADGQHLTRVGALRVACRYWVVGTGRLRVYVFDGWNARVVKPLCDVARVVRQRVALVAALTGSVSKMADDPPDSARLRPNKVPAPPSPQYLVGNRSVTDLKLPVFGLFLSSRPGTDQVPTGYRPGTDGYRRVLTGY
ncbi:TATDN1 [Symbiodinium natans]|uniref:TATDN1 protein n=1 Tax=Symbiodinium natans TaxID=878477 RepID=A0A812TMY7_9DINO|nr:TATDN1 [Symbiodinium natans]